MVCIFTFFNLSCSSLPYTRETISFIHHSTTGILKSYFFILFFVYFHFSVCGEDLIGAMGIRLYQMDTRLFQIEVEVANAVADGSLNGSVEIPVTQQVEAKVFVWKTVCSSMSDCCMTHVDQRKQNSYDQTC